MTWQEDECPKVVGQNPSAGEGFFLAKRLLKFTCKIILLWNELHNELHNVGNPGQVRSGQVKLGQVKLGQVRSFAFCVDKVDELRISVKNYFHRMKPNNPDEEPIT